MPAFVNGLSWKDFFDVNELLYSFDVNKSSAPHQGIVGYTTVYLRCIRILYEPQAFQAWLDSQGRSKRLELRQGVVLQLREIDAWLHNRNREQKIRCTIVHLYRITNALLKAENAITNGSLEAVVPGNPHDDFLGRIVHRHSKTLTILRNLVEECLPEEEIESHREDTLKEFKRHSKILQALTGISPGLFGSVLNFDHIYVLLDNLRRLLKALKYTKEEERLERSDKENIKDVRIWRCILIYLLFSTAPDNTKILTSGLWEQVVPII